MSNLCCQQFYEVQQDDGSYPDQWFLDDPRTANEEELDARDFVVGQAYRGPTPVTVPIYKPGSSLAFSFGSFDMPVVTIELARILSEIAPDDMESFPVAIPGAKERHAILNVTTCLDCLDEERSVFTVWTLEDSPDRAGQYHSISKVRVDPRRIEGHHIFRLSGFSILLFVSARVKEAIERIPDLGVVFKAVT